MTALPVNNWKTISCQVSTLAVQLDTLGLITPLHSQEWNKWFLVAFSIGPWEGWNLTIHKELPCFLSGEQHTPATGVNKCSNPDEGTLNEVSSLANEKFISSRNKYGAKGKAVLVSVLEARHCIQVCWAAHKMNELVAQNNKLTCRGVYSREIYITQPPSQATTWYWYIWELNQPQAQA